MRKRVLLISNKVFQYRVSIYNYLNARLSAIDYELVVLTNEVQMSNSQEAEFDLQISPLSFINIRKAIQECQPKVIILFLHLRDFAIWPSVVWMRLKRHRMIYWGHGVNLLTPDNKIKRLFFGFLHRLADAIILYSPNEKKFVADVHHHKIFVANNTLNFRDFPEVSETKSQIKKKYGIDFARVILFVGRITKQKRLDDLLDAASLLDDGICVVIVGSELDADQRRKVDASANIIYLGEVYDIEAISEIFKMSDIFSIPGKIGLGINQAMYWGLPVVTENVRHSPEIAYLTDGVNGFIVQKHSSRELADKCNYLLSRPDIHRQFSEAARSSIIENADIDIMCDGFVEAISALE